VFNLVNRGHKLTKMREQSDTHLPKMREELIFYLWSQYLVFFPHVCMSCVQLCSKDKNRNKNKTKNDKFPKMKIP